MRKVFYNMMYPYPKVVRQRYFYDARGIDPRMRARLSVAKRVSGCAFAVSEMACKMVKAIANSPFTPKGGH